MNKFKTLSVLIITILFLSSCSKDDDILEDRDKFLGTYLVVDNGVKFPNTSTSMAYELNYESIISIDDNDVSRINISNFFNISDFGAQEDDIIFATVNGVNLKIESQNFLTINFEGTGTISNNGVISINWIASEANSYWQGTAVYTPN